MMKKTIKNVCRYLNTSHVNVNQKQPTEYSKLHSNLNTSHVNVNLTWVKKHNWLGRFKYISC